MSSWGIVAWVFVGGIALGRISVKQPVEAEPMILEPEIQAATEQNMVEREEPKNVKPDYSGGEGRDGVITNEDVLLLARSLSGFERLQLRLGIKKTADLNDRFRLFESERQSAPNLTDTFQVDFELGDIEMRKLQELISTVNSEFENLEATLAKGSGTEDGLKWAFEIPTFPERGGVLYDRLSQGLASAIGPEKMAVFHETYGAQFERKFGEMGTRERTLTLSLLPSGSDGGDQLFEILDYSRTVNGQSRSSTSRLPKSDLRSFLGSIVEKFPPEFLDPSPKD